MLHLLQCQLQTRVMPSQRAGALCMGGVLADEIANAITANRLAKMRMLSSTTVARRTTDGEGNAELVSLVACGYDKAFALRIAA